MTLSADSVCVACSACQQPQETSSGQGAAVLSFMANSNIGKALLEHATGQATLRGDEAQLYEDLEKVAEAIEEAKSSAASLFSKSQSTSMVQLRERMRKMKGKKGAPAAFVKQVSETMVSYNAVFTERFNSAAKKSLTDTLKAPCTCLL